VADNARLKRRGQKARLFKSQQSHRQPVEEAFLVSGQLAFSGACYTPHTMASSPADPGKEWEAVLVRRKTDTTLNSRMMPLES